MIIEKVELENIVSHRRTVVEFSPGITVIVGPNGAGKTGIIDAITYALFSFHSREARKKDAIIRMGASRACIRLTFSVHGKRYVVEKVLLRGQTTQARLYELQEGALKLRASGAKAVEAEIERILGISREVARATFVARQGEIDLLLEDRRARLDFINTILGLERIEKARERLPELIAKWSYRKGALEKEAENLKVQIASLEAKKAEELKLKRRVEELRGILKKLEDVAEELDRKREELEKELERVQGSIRRLEELENLRSNLVRELHELKRRLDEAKKAKEALEAIERLAPLIQDLKLLKDLVERREELRRRVEELRERRRRYCELKNLLRDLEPRAQRYEELKRELSSLKELYEKYRESLIAAQEREAMLERLDEKRAELSRELVELAKEVYELAHHVEELTGLKLPQPPTEGEELAERIPLFIDHCLKLLSDAERSRRREVEKLGVEVGRIESRISELSKKLEELSKARGVCPLCGQPLTEEHRVKIIKKLGAEKRRLNQELGEVKKALEDVRSAVARIEGIRSRVTALASKAASIASELRSVKESIEKLEHELNSLRRRILELVALARQYEDASRELEELEGHYRGYIRVRTQLDELEKLLEGEGDIEAELDNIEEEVRSVLSKYGLNEEEALSLASKVEEVERRRVELASKAGAIKVLEERYKELEEKLRELEKEIIKVREEARKEAKLREELIKVNEELGKVRGECRRVIGELGEALGSLKALEAEMERLNELRQRLDSVQRQLKAVNKVCSFLTKMRGVLSPEGLPKVVRSLAKAVVEDALRRMLSDFTLDYIDVKLDEDFDVKLVTREGEKPASMLSGGERVVVALALRLALTQLAASSIGVLIMDEPTIHLDAERRKELVNAIRKGFAASKLSQLILVTHDPELEDAADTIISVVKMGGVSHVSVKKHPEELLRAALS